MFNKNTIMAIWVAVFVLIGSQGHRVEAADYYLGTYNNGQEAYLVTESIEEEEIIARNGEWAADKYYCTVKAVTPGVDTWEPVEYVVTYWSQTGFSEMEKNGTKVYMLRSRTKYLKENPVERNLVAYFSEYRK